MGRAGAEAEIAGVKCILFPDEFENLHGAFDGSGARVGGQSYRIVDWGLPQIVLMKRILRGRF